FLSGGETNGARNGSGSALDLSNPTGTWAALPAPVLWRTQVSGASVGVAFYTVGGDDPALIKQFTVLRYYNFPLLPLTPTITPTRTNTNTITPTNTPTITPTKTPTSTNTPS